MCRHWLCFLAGYVVNAGLCNDDLFLSAKVTSRFKRRHLKVFVISFCQTDLLKLENHAAGMYGEVV